MTLNGRKNKQNLTQLGPEEKKDVLLSLVERVADILEKNNLAFFMYYGTLLGSVRHQGFIPWDDDIDLAMLRRDYDELKQIDWAADGLELISPQVSSNCPYRLAKIVDNRYPQVEELDSLNGASGINIDIFPIDISGSIFHRYALSFLAQLHSAKVTALSGSRSFSKNLVLALIKYVTFFASIGGMTQLIDSLSSGKVNNGNLMGNLSGSYGVRELVAKCHFEGVTKLKFECIELPAPIGYDFILTSLYGDYWILPPQERRVTHHAAKIFAKRERD